VSEELLGVTGVRAVHELHTWSLSATHALVSVHVAIGVYTHTHTSFHVLPLSITVKVTHLKLHYFSVPSSSL